MGTSTRWTGPKGRAWASAAGSLNKSIREILEARALEEGVAGGAEGERSTVPGGLVGADGAGPASAPVSPGVKVVEFDLDELERHYLAFSRALVDELRNDQESFGLRDAVETCGRQYVSGLIDLRMKPWVGHPAHGDLRTSDARNALISFLVEQSCPPGSTLAQAMTRQAAVRVSTALVEEAVRRRAPLHRESLLGDELFCLIFRMFFAEVVTEFLATLIAAKISVVVPVLVLVDPGGLLSTYIAEKVAKQMPTPCEERDRRPRSPMSEIAEDLVDEMIPRWLETALDGEPS